MVVWFRYGSSTLGVEDGVIRAADFAALVSLQEAADAVQVDRVKIISEAQAQAENCINDAQLRAEALLRDAQEQSDLLITQAQEQYAAAYDKGFGKGCDDAITQWTENALVNANNSHLALQRQRERLSGVVALAVETMVEEEDKQAIFRRALRTVSKLVRDVPMLTLRVHYDDKDAAQKAITDMVDQLHVKMPIEVIADATSVEGCCTFESDQGVIDASLVTQLAAIKRAVARAAKTASLFSDLEIEQAPKAVETEQTFDTEEENSLIQDTLLTELEAVASEETPATIDNSIETAMQSLQQAESDDDQHMDEAALIEAALDDGLEYEASMDDAMVHDIPSFTTAQPDTAIRLSNPS
jgi:type III secretion protein L